MSAKYAYGSDDEDDDIRKHKYGEGQRAVTCIPGSSGGFLNGLTLEQKPNDRHGALRHHRARASVECERTYRWSLSKLPQRVSRVSRRREGTTKVSCFGFPGYGTCGPRPGYIPGKPGKDGVRTSPLWSEGPLWSLALSVKPTMLQDQ